jgi:Ca-activated chloride channel family protein
VIVVLSDGEITTSSGADAGLRAVLRSGVRIVPLALGSSEGTQVPDQGAPLRDAEGAIVISRRHDAALERLARATGGAFQAANEWGAFDLPAVIAAVRRELADAEGEWIIRREVAASVLPFACVAALLLLLEGIPFHALARGRSRTRLHRAVRASTRSGALRAALCMVPLVLLGAEHGPATTAIDAEARAALLRGLTHAELGDWPAAWEGLQEAAALAEDPALSSLAWYDLGVLYLEIGPLVKARDAFYEALALEPDDDEARFNLEWTLLAIERDASAKPPLDRMKEPSARRDPEDDREGSRDGPADPEDGSLAMRPDRDDSSGEESAAPEQSAMPQSPRADAGERARLEPIDPAELQRWLERIEDDPSRSMRARARGDGSHHTKSGPSW